MDSNRFRVWDVDNNCYLKEISWIYRNGKMAYLNHFDEDVEMEHDKFLIERCTGLKDAKGTLIYEGDIVQFEYSKRNRTIIFKDCSFMISGLVAREEFYPIASVANAETFFDKYIVIGTIHTEARNEV